MNNKIIASILGVVLVLGGVYFLMGRGSDNMETPNSIAVGEPNPNVPQTETSNKKMSFGAFLKQGGSYVCTVTQNMNGTESKGTVYVDGENLRGTFTTSVSGINMSSEFLSTGGYMYSWSSQMPGKGFKFPMNKETVGNTSVNTSSQYSWNSDMVGDYDCDAWSGDKSKFSVPSGISFTEFKQQ